MAYRDKGNASGKMDMKGYNQGDMSPMVESFQKPESCYSQKYDQSPTKYKERQDRLQMGEGSKLKKQDFKGRYS